MPGVKIGINCVVGAKSVVTKSILDNSVYAGNPAHLKIRKQSPSYDVSEYKKNKKEYLRRIIK